MGAESVGSRAALESELGRIDGRPYPAYRDLKGRWELDEDIVVGIDHVQGDPFASPSRLHLEVPTDLVDVALDRDAREACEDFLLRRFAAQLEAQPPARRGSGGSGRMRVYRPGPEVCERSAVRLAEDGSVTVRFAAGLPARGRRILGREARTLLLAEVLRAARAVQVTAEDVSAHVACVVRQRTLRRQLADQGLVAFIEDGSCLARISGIDPRPMPDAVPFVSPPSMRVTLHDLKGHPCTAWGFRRGSRSSSGVGFMGNRLCCRRCSAATWTTFPVMAAKAWSR